MITGKKPLNWLFDAGAAITCMNASSFRDAVQMVKLKLIKTDEGCLAAKSTTMNSLSVSELPMTIRGRKFLPPVVVIGDIKDNIINNLKLNHAHPHAHKCPLLCQRNYNTSTLVYDGYCKIQ